MQFTAQLEGTQYIDNFQHYHKDFFTMLKRGLLSEITYESAQALEAQRHSVSRSYTRDDAKRDTHNLEVV